MDVIEIAALDAVELLAAFAGGQITPLQALQGVTERIARKNPEINAFATLNPSALNAARVSALRWQEGRARALEGVPVTVNDLIDVAGLPTRCGSKTTSSEPVKRDSPLVAVLRAAGAVIVGKTNVSEFGWKYQGDSPLFGIIRNPWNVLYTAGGPSGGAAAAAAGFFAPLHISDGAVCVAAAWNGVVGLKVGTMSENQGLVARSVADVALLSSVLKGQEQPAKLETSLQGLKVGILRTPGFAASATDQIWNAVSSAKGILMDQGAAFLEIVPQLPSVDEIFVEHWGAKRVKDVSAVSFDQIALIDPDLTAVAAQLGASMPPDQQKYADACTQATQAMEACGVDVILCPAVARTAPMAGIETSAPLRALVQDWAPWTMLFALTGQPTLTLPMGVDSEGLPIAIQLAGRGGAEAILLRVAKALEAGLG